MPLISHNSTMISFKVCQRALDAAHNLIVCTDVKATFLIYFYVN